VARVILVVAVAVVGLLSICLWFVCVSVCCPRQLLLSPRAVQVSCKSARSFISWAWFRARKTLISFHFRSECATRGKKRRYSIPTYLPFATCESLACNGALGLARRTQARWGTGEMGHSCLCWSGKWNSRREVLKTITRGSSVEQETKLTHLALTMLRDSNCVLCCDHHMIQLPT
jgi:hypothetical protein